MVKRKDLLNISHQNYTNVMMITTLIKIEIKIYIYIYI